VWREVKEMFVGDDVEREQVDESTVEVGEK